MGSGFGANGRKRNACSGFVWKTEGGRPLVRIAVD
jgi:hypothetical protein